MVLHRINGSQHDHPNPYINFIRVLGDETTDKLHKNKNFQDMESARFIMKAIAAQVLPIMKFHCMGLNSFNEYEWNPEFSGRNWNGGEVIELVLRRKDGNLLPMQYLLTVMAHELAHIHHMNHGPQFQKLNQQLRKEIQELQQKEYYGPGFWSSGQRLKDSAKLAGDANLNASDLPEYACGGSEKRGTRRRVYRPTTVRKKKADRFVGEGQKLEPTGASSFRKRANAANAKNARALAAEKRMLQKDKDSQALKQTKTNSASNNSFSNIICLDEDDEESEMITKLQDEWEKFEPQEPQTAMDQEKEKIGLRDEMKEILVGFNVQRQVETPCTKLNSKSNPQQGSSKLPPLDKSIDDDEIQIISQSSKPKSSQKRKLTSPSVQAKNKLQKVVNSSDKTNLKKNDTNRPTQSSSTINNPSIVWKCLICCQENQIDFGCCTSCLYPQGTTAPKWDQL